jgi:hypothetical protein
LHQSPIARPHDWAPDVVIPPRACAVLSTDEVEKQTARDRHITILAEKGRMGWQRATGYGRRSLVETTIGRYKHLIGPKLRARVLPAQQGEAAIAVAVLNRMIQVAKPISVRRMTASGLGYPRPPSARCNNAAALAERDRARELPLKVTPPLAMSGAELLAAIERLVERLKV